MLCYQNGKSIITTPCYKDVESMITSLIIIKIRFVCFYKDKIGGLHVRSHARLHVRSRARSYNHRLYGYSVIFSQFCQNTISLKCEKSVMPVYNI